MKIAIVGPESSGKTTLAKQLSALFRGVLVPEVVRELLIPSQGHYIESEVAGFCLAQIMMEDEVTNKEEEIYFCDTAPVNFYVWSQVKYGKVHPDIVKCCEERTYSHTLLLAPDIAWQPDPLREDPDEDKRKEIFELHHELLNQWGHSFSLVHGEGQERWQNAALQVKAVIEDNK